MYTIDLRTAVIEADRCAYMVHPGKDYHLFGAFLAHDVIAPDLPELTLKDGVSPITQSGLDLQIKRARELRDWLALSEADRKKSPYTKKLTDYANLDKRRYHDSYRDNANLMLWELPEGAVVFVPNSDLAGQGIFCELGSPQASRKTFKGAGKARDFNYLGRPVRNIQRVPMRFIPPEILEAKSRQSIVTELNDELSERIFRLYYGSFSVVGGVTQIEVDIPSASFSPADAAVLSGVANLFEDNFQKFESGELNATKFVDALFLTFDEAELQLHARLNSPGIVQIAAKSMTPLLVSAFMALSGVATAKEIHHEAQSRSAVGSAATQSVNVINTSCPKDKQFPRLIEERLFGILDMMGEDEIERVCERFDQLKKRTNATTDAIAE